MSLVNRVALIVRPKRRYKEWADSVADGDEDPIFDLDEARAAPAVYLVARSKLSPSLQDLIDEYADDIFEDQLDGWHTDEAAWPINRSPHVFRDWFDVSVAEWVIDLDDEEPFEVEDAADDGEEDDLVEALQGVPGAELKCAWCHSPMDRDEEVVTVTLKGTRPATPTTEVIELEIEGRIVPAICPREGSPAAASGAMALVMFCGDDCARAFQDAWNRERGALSS